MAVATKEELEKEIEETPAAAEVPTFSDEQLKDVELSKTQLNTIADLKKVMKQPQIDELILDFKRANIVKKQSGEKRLREATTEFTKEHALIFVEVNKKDSNLTEIATRHGMEVTAIPNVIREIKSKLFTILSTSGQINHDVVTELLKQHATAEPRKKRDKKVKVAGENGAVDGESDDGEDDDDDNDDDANAGTTPTFTAEELAALEAAE